MRVDTCLEVPRGMPHVFCGPWTVYICCNGNNKNTFFFQKLGLRGNPTPFFLMSLIHKFHVLKPKEKTKETQSHLEGNLAYTYDNDDFNSSSGMVV